MEKRLVKNSRDAKELFAFLGITDREPLREELPGVFIYQPRLLDSSRPGTILGVITIDDFVPDSSFREAEQLVELLTGDRYQGNIAPDQYPVIERSMRRVVNLRDKIGKVVVDLMNRVRTAELIYDGMVDYETLQIMQRDQDNRITVARTKAKNICYEYGEKVAAAKYNRDLAVNLEKTLTKTIDIYRTIMAKLRREFEDLKYGNTGA